MIRGGCVWIDSEVDKKRSSKRFEQNVCKSVHVTSDVLSAFNPK